MDWCNCKLMGSNDTKGVIWLFVAHLDWWLGDPHQVVCTINSVNKVCIIGSFVFIHLSISINLWSCVVMEHKGWASICEYAGVFCSTIKWILNVSDGGHQDHAQGPGGCGLGYQMALEHDMCVQIRWGPPGQTATSNRPSSKYRCG